MGVFSIIFIKQSRVQSCLMKRHKRPLCKNGFKQLGNLYLLWPLFRLDIQLRPDDLLSLNTGYGNTPRHMLLSIDLRSMIVQFGPHGVSLYCSTQHLSLEIWHRRKKEAPVFPHACLPSEVSFWIERLLAAKVGRKTGHHRFKIVAIRGLYHALEYYLR